jgi:LuxR family transcriptional regulator, activator of conjugal transfer of Ti plasmids
MFANSAETRGGIACAYRADSGEGRSGLAAMAALVGDLADRDTPEALRAWLAEHAQAHGFRGARYSHLGHFPALPQLRDAKLVRFLSTHDDHAALWTPDAAEGRALLVTFLPFAWSMEDGAGLSGAQRRWVVAQQLQDHPGGITVPVQDHPAGPACLILFGGSEGHAAERVATQAPTLLVQALCFHLAAKAVLPAGATRGDALSDREIACLRLAAMGDTLAEAAEQLGISVRTVEMHVARASRKLNATNKIHAVALAVGAGLLQI